MEITQNGTVSIVPNGIDEMELEVNVPSNVQYSKTFDLTTNGVHKLVADDGYDGIHDITCNVNVPIPDLDIYQITYIPLGGSAVTKTISELRTSTITISERSFVIYKQGLYIYIKFYTVATDAPPMSSGICVNVSKASVISLKNRAGQSLFVIDPNSDDEGAPNFSVELQYGSLLKCDSLI